MAEETLITAARRMVRFLRIDEAKGGFIQQATTQAADTLEKQLRIAIDAEKVAHGDTNKDQGEL